MTPSLWHWPVRVISIVVCALVASTARLANTQRDLEEDLDVVAPRWEKCLRFAAAHVLTMSWGSVVPVDTSASVWQSTVIEATSRRQLQMESLAVLLIALGLLVNVFVFSVVVAKFQAPQSDLVWSEGCVILSRDGVPHLLMRVGNLRCHTLVFPAHPSHAAEAPCNARKARATLSRDDLGGAVPA